MSPSDSSPLPLPRSGSSQPGPTLSSSLLSIEEVERFKSLLLFAKATVDGFLTEQPQFPDPEPLANFGDRQDHVPEYALDRSDWCASDPTCRRFNPGHAAAKDVVTYLLVDTSASMRYIGEKPTLKFNHAARIAALLADLMLRLGEKPALGLYADVLTTYLPPGDTGPHLSYLTRALEEAQPTLSTGGAAALHQARTVLKKPGRLVVLSDFLIDPVPLLDALSQFRQRGFSVLLLQILDQDELNLPLDGKANYVDLESGEPVEIEAETLRAAYRQKIQATIETLARAADRQGIEHQLVDTAKPYAEELKTYLNFRVR